ncbi:unnamed protein product, partial [Mesorhabditis belari]|uniref:Receptor expression-enhancing protein n=1 Tax=Mesorhabditis belari TaxID=2138241 RepID=A0AAF3EG86_9BILA
MDFNSIRFPQQQDLRNFLYTSHGETYDRTLHLIEEKTRLKREQIFYGLLGLVLIYLIFGSLAQFVCNLIGFAYPAYASVKAIRSPSKGDDTQWLIYWTVFASFSMLDFFTDSLLHYFPFYYVAKVIFLLYLYLPQTRGALFFYSSIIDPAITTIDQWLNSRNITSMENRDFRKTN